MEGEENSQRIVAAANKSAVDRDAESVEASLTQSVGKRLAAVKDLKKYVDLKVFGTSADSDEAAFILDENLKQHWFGLLHPETVVSATYDLFQMSLIVYLLFTLPYNLAFGLISSGAMFGLDVMIDVALVFDIFLSMNRYHRQKRGARVGDIVTDKRVIRRRYMKSWFVVDLVAVIPFDYLVLLIDSMWGDGNGTSRNEVRTARMLRLTKLSRFARLSKLTKLKSLRKIRDVVHAAFENLGMTKMGFDFGMRLTGLCFVLLGSLHLLSCIWLYMGLATIDAAAAADEALQNQSHATGVQVDAALLNRHWMLMEYGSVEAAKSKGNWVRYVDATYWTVVTASTVGFGDIRPRSEEERIFGSIAIVIFSFLTAYILGTFSNMLSDMDQDKSSFDSKMRSVTQLLKFLRAPEDLQDQVTNFYEYKWANQTMFNAEVMDELPPQIRSDLTIHRFAMVIDKVPFFNGLRADAVVDICSLLQSYSVMPNHVIIDQGEPYRDLVILTAGVARTKPPDEERALSGERRSAKQMKQGELNLCIEYGPGSFFGELEFLGLSEVRTVTVVALRFVEVSTLSPEAIQPILDIHIGLRRRLMRYVKLKKHLDDMLETSDTIDAVMLEEMKEQIENKFEQEELRGIFNDVDELSDGKLGPEEFAAGLESLGICVDREHVELEFKEIVKYKTRLAKGGEVDTEIDYNDFEEFWLRNENNMRSKHHDMNLVNITRDNSNRVQNIEQEVAATHADMVEIKKLISTIKWKK